MFIRKCTKFSAEELQKSVANRKSCVAKVQLNEILSLLPRDCEHIVKGVRRCVSEKVGRYHAKLNGIVLGYEKVRIENPLSALRLDSPYLHVRATIDYYVFQPKIGSILQGTVNYVSKAFLSAVIYRVFNVTVKLDMKSRKMIREDMKIKFKVNACDMKSEVPVIEGTLVDYTPSTSIKQEPDVQEETGSDELAKEPVVKKEPDSDELPKAPVKKSKQKKVPEQPPPPPVAMYDSSSSSESEDDERSLLIKSLLGQMFGDEYTNGTKDSSKKSKKKKKETKKTESPQKTIVPEMPVRIKQEQLSMDEDESSENEQNTSTAGRASKQNGTNGVHLNGSAGAAATASSSDDGQTPAKKRKIRFDLTPTVVHIKTEPTESSKKKKKTLNK